MTSLPLELQGQVAVFVALLCLCSGAVLWEAGKRPGKWLGRITIAAGIFQLAAFSEYAVNQYEVVIARVSIPALKVVNSDTGRKQTIQRINCPDGVLFERVLTAGWSATNGAYRHRQPASGAVLRRTHASTRSSAEIPTGTEGAGGSNCRCLAVPGCCNGDCPNCICNQLEIAGNVREF